MVPTVIIPFKKNDGLVFNEVGIWLPSFINPSKKEILEEATRIQLLPDFTNLKRVIFLGSWHFPLIRLNITLRSKKLFSIDYTQLLGIFNTFTFLSLKIFK